MDVLADVSTLGPTKHTMVHCNHLLMHNPLFESTEHRIYCDASIS